MLYQLCIRARLQSLRENHTLISPVEYEQRKSSAEGTEYLSPARSRRRSVGSVGKTTRVPRGRQGASLVSWLNPPLGISLIDKGKVRA
jgi:hypothetical protein